MRIFTTFQDVSSGQLSVVISTLSKIGFTISLQVMKNEDRYEGNNVGANEGSGESPNDIDGSNVGVDEGDSAGSNDIDGSNVGADDVDGAGEGHPTPNSILESSLSCSLLPP